MRDQQLTLRAFLDRGVTSCSTSPAMSCPPPIWLASKLLLAHLRTRFVHHAAVPIHSPLGPPQRLRVVGPFGVFTLLFLMACAPAAILSHPSKPIAPNPTPEPAIPAILAAFDKYDVVVMPVGHGMKDVGDFILDLIRDPRFPDKVDDIVVECGNSLYQPVLDLYIAGMDVPFAEVRKTWRNTTQSMCGLSGFFEQFFPLVRAINQKLPPPKRLRVLAGDPPIDWEVVSTPDDAWKFLQRDPVIAAIMEKEVLSKRRKALMLFGTLHLTHGTADDGTSPTSQRNAPPSAVSIYEEHYPNRTFVLSDLGTYEMRHEDTSPGLLALWPNPSVVPIKGTRLGTVPFRDFRSPPVAVQDCVVTNDFPPGLQKPIEALVDAILYLGPQEFMLNEPIPAGIALDTEYLTELLRRESLIGPPGAPMGSLADLREELMQQSEHPIRVMPKPPNAKEIERDCLERKKHDGHR